MYRFLSLTSEDELYLKMTLDEQSLVTVFGRSVIGVFLVDKVEKVDTIYLSGKPHLIVEKAQGGFKLKSLTRQYSRIIDEHSFYLYSKTRKMIAYQNTENDFIRLQHSG